MTYDDLLLTAGGVPLILADLRARALASGQSTAAPRAAIGSNLKCENRPLLANLFADGVTWQDEKSNYAYVSEPVDAPAGSRFSMLMPPPFADGEWHVARWREPGNTSGVSRYTRVYTNYDLNQTGTRFTDLTETYANGVFSARFRYYGRTTDGIPNGLIRWAGQGTVQLLTCRPENMAATDHFNPLVVQISSERRGNIRGLDGPYAAGNVWTQDWLWSERARIDPDLNRGTRQIGLPLELWRDLAILTNRDLEIIITHKLPKSTVQAMMRAFFTGEGFDDGKALPPHLNLYVELCSNESWNPQLTGAYQDLARIGYDTGYTGTDENYARLYAQESRCRQVAAWIAEAVPAYMDRIVRIIGLSPANDMNDYLSLTANSKSYFDAVSKSIYMGIFAKANYGNNTPAEIASAWSADATAQVDAFLNNLSTYRADGKRLLSYETGSDCGAVPWGFDKRATWLESSEFRAIYKREMLRAATATMDRINLYWDFGPYLSDQPQGAWAHYQGPGRNNQKWDVANEVQAALDAMAD